MELSKIVSDFECEIFNDCTKEVVSIEFDSRKVIKNSMFVCLVGDNNDGNDFIQDAINNGASVIVSDTLPNIDIDVTFIKVQDTRKAYSVFCNNFYNQPNKKLKTIAVVGTNGKTTTTYILQNILETAGYRVGIIGTLGVVILGEVYDSMMTTPDAFDTNKYLQKMVDNNVDFAIIEVSAHAIFYQKTAFCFDYTIFTNFSEDHLDFFENMQNYFMTKLSFFTADNTKIAIVNSDDELGKTILNYKYLPQALANVCETDIETNQNENEIVSESNIDVNSNQKQSEIANSNFYQNQNTIADKSINKDICNANQNTIAYKSINKDFYNINQFKNDEKYKKVRKFSFGIQNPCDVFAIDINLGKKTDFVVNAFDKIYDINSRLQGKHNVYNILGAVTLCEILGISYQNIYEGIRTLDKIEGRFNVLNKGEYLVVVDFAHTEDGLRNLLESVKKYAPNRKIVTLFGCGGNRDKNKRAKMGKVASIMSNKVILTSDNPRYEKPMDIIEDIKQGMDNNYIVIEDRKDAIEYAIDNLTTDEILVIAGKGGEKTQEINGVFYPQNDTDIVEKCLNEK